MFYLEDKNEVIKQYTLSGYTLEQVKAKVWQRQWDDKYIMPTLAYIEVTTELRGLGLAKRLLIKVMKENKFLLFQNNNNSFWEKLSYDKQLPFVVLLHGDTWGELVYLKTCSGNIHYYSQPSWRNR